MSAPGSRRAGSPAPVSLSRRIGAAVLATALVAGCDDTLEPFREHEDAIFSMFGHLDLKADTQWVRVMPVRQDLFLGPEPIDAVVTLEDLDSGRIVTLNDSLFRFTDQRLGAVAYAHNFWTTERLQPEATYRLRAARSDGASTTAVIVMPPEMEIVYLQDSRDRRIVNIDLFQVRAEQVLFVDVLYGMGRLLPGDPPDTVPARPIAIDDYWTFTPRVPGTHGFGTAIDTLIRPGLVDVQRHEMRFVVGRSDWPYDPGLSDVEVTVPNAMPSNVENGLGFVGGVATWTIPVDICGPLAERPDREDPCATRFNAQSASIAGRVVREPCGDPHYLQTIRLTERFAGGGIIRTWKTGWDGEYRFDGIEPNAELVLEPGSGAPAVQLPPLAEGERYTVEDISVPAGC